MKDTEKVTGTIKEITQAETLLLDDEVGAIEFTVHTEAGSLVLLALETDGTAYHTLQNDQRFRKGVQVIVFRKGARCIALRLDLPDQHNKAVEADIERLKDKAMKNMSMTIGELYALLNAFDTESVQAYALALHLHRQGERTETVVQIANQDAICTGCKSTLHISPGRAYAFSDNFCPSCNRNVRFTLSEPRPRAVSEDPPMSLEEIQAALKQRFGD